MMFDLSGRRALVTGASGGIGSAIVAALAAQGADVALSGTRAGALESLRERTGSRAVGVFPCDLSDSAAVAALVPAVEAHCGGIDILVNNAGITCDSLILRMRDEDLERVLAIDLSAALRLARAAVRGMMKRRHGRIINITSVVASDGNPGQTAYAAAKAGLEGAARTLARELATRGITVNCIAPGFIDTDMTARLDDAWKQAILSAIPAGRAGTAAEIAAAAVFLASNEAAYVNGHILHVNGGMHS